MAVRFVSFRFRFLFGSGRSLFFGSCSFRFRYFPVLFGSVLSGVGCFRFVLFSSRFGSVPPFRVVTHAFLLNPTLQRGSC